MGSCREAAARKKILLSIFPGLAKETGTGSILQATPEVLSGFSRFVHLGYHQITDLKQGVRFASYEGTNTSAAYRI